MRRSSSLQDLSTYHHLDPESDFYSGADVNLIHAKQLHPLDRGIAGSNFSKEKAPLGSHVAPKKWSCVIIVLLCLLLFAALMFALQFYFSNSLQGTTRFYVVLDCGSTGTRVYVYQASLNNKKDSSLPIILTSLPEGLRTKPSSQGGHAYNRMERRPGLDKLVHNVAGLEGALKPLIQWAEKQIPENEHRTTSLFLYATAGVRRLPSSDSRWLLEHVLSILKGSPFMCHKEWVKIISGTEEAYYGWIALNYHTGVLGALPKKATFGALDLGGSSMQITFESKEQVYNENSLRLSIGTVSHHLNAYSLSGYGLNDAFDKSVAHLLKMLPGITKADLDSGNIEIKHPCLQSRYKEKYLCSHCASIYQQGGSPTSGGEVLGGGGKPGISVHLIGAPKWDKCRELAKAAVNLSEWSDVNPGLDCELQPCALADNIPHPYGQFYAISGFFVVYRFYNLSPDATLDIVLKKGQEFCKKSWDIAKRSVAPQPFIEQYCFRAPYIVFLLREGLQLTDSQIIIGSGSITWTLGVALFEAGKAFPNRALVPSYEILQMKIKPFILVGILFASFSLFLFALSCLSNRMPRFIRRQYLPLFQHDSAFSGDGRVKMPLSPATPGAQQSPFVPRHSVSGKNIQLKEFSPCPASRGVSHSYSSSSLVQMQFDNAVTASSHTPHKKTGLQSRRSESQVDLNFSLAEAPLPKV
ncbi:Apyrase [Bertholletia excelsa]